MEFSRPEYWSSQPFPSPVDLPDPGIELGSPALPADSLPTELSCVDHNKLWQIIKEMGILEHLTCLLRNLYAGQEAELELDMDQLAGSKSGKVYIKAVYCHPAYVNLYLGWKVKVGPSVVSQSLQPQGL